MKPLKVLFVDFSYESVYEYLTPYYFESLIMKHYKHEVDFVHKVVTDWQTRGSHFPVAMAIENEKPDLLCFGLYLWNVEYIMKVASTIKQVRPEVLILTGGPEVTNDNNFLYNNGRCFDLFARGEGEGYIMDVIRYLLEKRDPFSIPGISRYQKDQGCIVHNAPDYRFFENLEDIPSTLIGEYATQWTAISRKKPDFRNITIETMRGCPYRCSFCFYFKGTDKIRYFPLERCLEEIRFVMKQGIHGIMFTDGTFLLNKERAYAILECCAQNNKNTIIFLETRAEGLDKELLDLMVRAGVKGLDIGLQSNNEKALSLIGRKHNPAKFERGVKQCLENEELPLFINLIAGLPHVGYREFLDSVIYLVQFDRAIKKNYAFYWLEFLPGTRVRKEAAEWGIQYSYYPPYEYVIKKDTTVNEVIKTNILMMLMNDFGLVSEILFKAILVHTKSKDYYAVIDNLIEHIVREKENVWFFSFGLDYIDEDKIDELCAEVIGILKEYCALYAEEPLLSQFRDFLDFLLFLEKSRRIYQETIYYAIKKDETELIREKIEAGDPDIFLQCSENLLSGEFREGFISLFDGIQLNGDKLPALDFGVHETRHMLLAEWYKLHIAHDFDLVILNICKTDPVGLQAIRAGAQAAAGDGEWDNALFHDRIMALIGNGILCSTPESETE